jgi:alpha-galactosidase
MPLMINQLLPKQWLLETQHTAYRLGLTPGGLLAHTYWGQRLPRQSDYPMPADSEGWASFNGPSQLVNLEYPTYAGPNYTEPAFKVTFADGVRDTVLEFKEAQLKGEELVLELQDQHYPLSLHLHYRVHPEHDLIERWLEIINQGDTPILLERAFSAEWHLPRGSAYRLTHTSGRWADESHLHRETLQVGVKVRESRRLTTSHHANPWFALDRGNADQDQGEVWFGALAWSGNWKMLAETTDFLSTRVLLGLNDWDFAWQLNPGETFTTPASLAGYTAHGFGAASRCLHDFIRDRVIPHGSLTHKVLYNSWEATLFDVDETSQIRLAELAAGMGVELFVLDDGWFHGRSSDHAGLGDWWPDEVKFPRGLDGLIKRVNQLGMEFGLWIEPEMVNPDSDLYRLHPEWTIHFPNRARTEMRNQLILNFGRADVQDYIIEKIDHLLANNPIAFIKWDMNRNVSEPGWPDAPGDGRELWVRYVQGLYHVWGTLRARHPEVIWQSCSGGGGRADLGILKFADQIWTSDNTEATARLAIQEGFSYIFPANVMEAWVTDAGRGQVPLEFRFHTSMCGSLGVGGNLLIWTEEEKALAAQCISNYKALREIIQLGDQYRLRSPQDSPFSAVQYVSKDRSAGALFAFRTWLPEPAQLPLVYPRGLDPDALYTIEGFEGTRSGLAWMQTGLQLKLNNLQSSLHRIIRC